MLPMPWRGGSWGPYIALRGEAQPQDQTDLNKGRDSSRESVEEAATGGSRGGHVADRSVPPGGARLWPCWRSLTHILYRQFKINLGENNILLHIYIYY